jgi:hypothetical protein
MWPLIIAIDLGGCFLSEAEVNPGKFVRNPLERADAKVERAGENKDAWAKATRSAGVADPIAELACSAAGLASGKIGGAA